ncbi:hypothetical protein N9B72_00190 [Bacteriovoracaceae bacterium]|nr:hypothetical protein [Bacteriovoracaceae bacterium]
MSNLIAESYDYLLEVFAQELLVSCKIMTKDDFKIKKGFKDNLHFSKPGKLFIYSLIGSDQINNKIINGLVGLNFDTETYAKFIPYLFNINDKTDGFQEIGAELLNMCIGRAKDKLSDLGITFKKNIPLSFSFDNLQLSQINNAHSIQEIEIHHNKFKFSIIQCFTESVD